MHDWYNFFVICFLIHDCSIQKSKKTQKEKKSRKEKKHKSKKSKKSNKTSSRKSRSSSEEDETETEESSDSDVQALNWWKIKELISTVITDNIVSIPMLLESSLEVFQL